MSVIHWKSTQAIKHMRKKPATLAVYWIYATRPNNEGVAWPSLRGLAHDTGWSVDACADARDWLVANGAIEQVKDYIRPEWRKLVDNARAQKLNLDKSEYYRLTGRLTIGSQTFDMLYFGGHEAEKTDVSSQPTSDIAQQRQQPTEHITSIESDSIESKDNTKKKLSSTRKREKVAKADNQETALFKELKEAIRSSMRWETPTRSEWGQINAAAKQLAEVGCPIEDVPPLHKHCAALFTTFTPMALATHYSTFKANRPKPKPVFEIPEGHYNPALDDGTPATLEQIQQAKAMFEALVKSKSGNSEVRS